MDIKSLIGKTALTFRREAPAIATAVAIASTVGAVVYAAKAGGDAREDLIREVRIREALKKEDLSPELTFKEKTKLVWKHYIPVGVLLCTSIAATVTLHRVGLNRTAAATALYSVTEKAFSDYRNKVIENMGAEKDEEIRKEVATDNIAKNPPSSEIVILNGNVLCYDSYSGRYFESSMDAIQKAENTVNFKIINEMYASLSDFYEELGVEPTEHSELVGWNQEELLGVTFSSTLTPDGKPCLAVDFRGLPFDQFSKLA